MRRIVRDSVRVSAPGRVVEVRGDVVTVAATTYAPPPDPVVQYQTEETERELRAAGGDVDAFLAEARRRRTEPDHPCDMFSPGKPTNGGCQGDGHYLCGECGLFDERCES